MSKRGTTRADLILKGARERVRIAEESVRARLGQLDIANASLAAHTLSLEQLEKDLAPTPRKVKVPKSTAPVAGKRSSRSKEKAVDTVSTATASGDVGSVPNCAICGKPADSPVHNSMLDQQFEHIFRTELKNSKAASV